MKTPKRPTVDELFTAANWLDADPDCEDYAALKKVREWLLSLTEQKRNA